MKLTVIGRLMWTQFDQSAEQTGMTRAKWTLIAAVAHAPGETQRAIASALQLSEVTVGRLIDRLCEDGYLERKENPDDRRSYRVYLTPAAQPVLDQLSELADTHTRQAFSGLDDKDLSKLEALLDIISRNIGAFRSE